MDAIYFGAVGWPATVPDNISLWGSLLKFRREFDQYVNLRPVRLFEGVPCPLVDAKGKQRKPGDIDLVIVRENTEGEYTNLGVMYPGTEREFVIRVGVLAAPTACCAMPDWRLAPRSLTVIRQRHRDQHAVVGQPRRRSQQGLPGESTNGTSTSGARFVLQPQLRRGGGEQPVRRHPVDLGPATTSTMAWRRART
jgi:hypothetical protein